MQLRLASMSPAAITVVGALINIVLAIGKLWVGALVGSASLLADGWHSAGDLVSDVICWIAVKIGARAPTERHPEGFGRIEHMLTLGIAAILGFGGITMTWASGGALLAALRAPAAALVVTTARTSFAAADAAALLVAFSSVASKEALFGVTHAIGIRNKSPSIIANAYHHRSDALSSLVAIVGIFGALCGVPWLDPLAATVVGLMVTAMGRDVAQESLEALLGAGEDASSEEVTRDEPGSQVAVPGAATGLVAPSAPSSVPSAAASPATVGMVQPSPSPSSRASQPQMMGGAVAMLGGTAAGGLHAISGPDHLAALLPLCLGRRWYRAASTGAMWGLGHGMGAALVGAAGFALRGALNIDSVSRYMEVAVGLSLIVIGATGLQEAQEWKAGVDGCAIPEDVEDPEIRNGGSSSEGLTMVACGEDAVPPPGVTRTLLNGIINGISGTGHVLGVLPALAMPSWAVAGAYLSCFGLGTLVTMALFTGLVGEVSSQMGSVLDQPAAPANLAMAASAVALAVGGLWTWRALTGLSFLRIVGMVAVGRD